MTTTNTDRLISIEAKVDKILAALTPAVPTPDPTPDPDPAPGAGQFRLGVGLIQGNFAADAKRLADKPGLVGAVHMVAFGGNNTGSDADSRVKWFPAGVDVMLHAAIAPSDLSVSGKAYDASTRLKSLGAVDEFADRVAAVVNANPSIKWVTFTNELKGYYGSNQGWDTATYISHFLAFAQELRAKATRHVDILGPYSTGQHGQSVSEGLDIRVRAVHDAFIPVVKAHPELVDGICWDDDNGSNHKAYTDYYAKRGITLPHWDVETYLGGWGAGTVSDATAKAEIKNISTNPTMGGVLIWGPGPRPDVSNSEADQKGLLWDSHQAAKPLWTGLIGQDYTR